MIVLDLITCENWLQLPLGFAFALWHRAPISNPSIFKNVSDVDVTVTMFNVTYDYC